ncbi:MAG: hypothetical protein J6C20_06240 [Paludibacteraceae bacterium]|nr:hypothetical protein [Paludibacteraceae bacterium]
MGRSIGKTARAIKDGVSGQFSENIKQGECDSPQRQLPKSIDCRFDRPE